MIENRAKGSLGKILGYLNNNKFSDLFDELSISKTECWGISTQLIQQIQSLFSNQSEHRGGSIGFLSQIHQQNHGKLFFTTKPKTDAEHIIIEKLFVKSGDGVVRQEGSNFEMVTISDQIVTLSLEDIPDHQSIVLNIIGNFRSNLEDNLYIECSNDRYSEAIRFGNIGVSHTTSGTTVICNTKIDKLYTIVLNRRFIKLYLNGILYIYKPIRIEFVPNIVRLKLLGLVGADLSALIKHMDIWIFQEELNNIFCNESTLFLALLNEYIETSSLCQLHDLLERVEGLDITLVEHQLLSLLTNDLEQGQGYKEWIFEKLLSRISKSKTEEWHKENIINIPKPVLEVKNLMVEFLETPNMRYSLSNFIKNRKNEKFRVLDNINFDVYPGDIIGIVGANGAGKSTLLKTISGVVPINQGHINLHAHHLLLSAGLGARSELTGRENIFLSGCFMGLNKKQIDKLFDEIVDFSELGDAIDRPFKYYSDGMKGRLVFSIATSVSPDILMLDELLSAGDIKFQQKAAKRMEQLIKRAKVVVVVTHSTQFVVEKCNKALLLSKGKQIYYGDPAKAIALYLNELHLQAIDYQTDFNPNNISMLQQINATSGMPPGGQHVR